MILRAQLIDGVYKLACVTTGTTGEDGNIITTEECLYIPPGRVIVYGHDGDHDLILLPGDTPEERDRLRASAEYVARDLIDLAAKPLGLRLFRRCVKVRFGEGDDAVEMTLDDVVTQGLDMSQISDTSGPGVYYNPE